MAELQSATLLLEQPPPTPLNAPIRNEADFVPGNLAACSEFWDTEILRNYTNEKRTRLLGWVCGVKLHEFIDTQARGEFLGVPYDGSHITEAEFDNHVPAEFEGWVDGEISKLAESGAILRWAEFADITVNPKPTIVLPMGVEPKKPRLFTDGRYLNNMFVHSEFQMDGVGKVSQIAWAGAQQSVMDHASGFHHVPLDPESWKYVGLCWKGEYYVWTVLCFGLSCSPYIYHTLSSAVGEYLRERDVPVLVWLDDFYFTNFTSTKSWAEAEQVRAAHAASHLVLSVFHRAGYFMSVKKCVLEPTTRLVYLGIECDSSQCRFEVPADKLDKLEVILKEAVSTQKITFATLEKLAGKCTSMQVAVPAAKRYTHFMYKQIAKFQKSAKSRVSATVKIAKNSGLMGELVRWLEVRERMNGAPWYKASHQLLSLTGATDASSSGWGGVTRGPDGIPFEAAADFPADWVWTHINEKEGYALLESLKLCTVQRPLQILGSTVVIDVDNTTLFHAFRKGSSKSDTLHNIIVDLFWLQVERDFTLDLRWVCSADNKEADDLSRVRTIDYVRLDREAFRVLWDEWGGSTWI